MADVLAVLFSAGVFVALVWVAVDVRRLRKDINKKAYYDDDGYF